MAEIEIVFDDGTAARWQLSEQNADIACAAVVKAVGEPDTIKA